MRVLWKRGQASSHILPLLCKGGVNRRVSLSHRGVAWALLLLLLLWLVPNLCNQACCIGGLAALPGSLHCCEQGCESLAPGLNWVGMPAP